MNESTENILKIMYDIGLYRELSEAWNLYLNMVAYNYYTSDIVVDMGKTLSERMTATLTSAMKDLPVYDGCKSLIIIDGNPALCMEKSEQLDIPCLMVVWHSSGLMRITHFAYQHLYNQFDKKKKTEKDFIRESMLNAIDDNCLLANEFDYEFEKIRSDEEIVRARQEDAQNKLNEKLCSRLWGNAVMIFRIYGKHFERNNIPLVTRYTLSRLRTIYNQHTEYEIDDNALVDRCTYTNRRDQGQKISSLLKQISNAEKLIATMPVIYARFDEFKQNITAHLIQLMLDKEDSSWNLKSSVSYCVWNELMPIIKLYPGLINMHERYIVTPGHQLYDLRASILEKYKKLATQTLTTDATCKNAATIFVPTEQHTNSILQNVSTIDIDDETYSIDDIKQVPIPIIAIDAPNPATDCSGKFDHYSHAYNITQEVVPAIRQIYKENPNDRKYIEVCIRTIIDDMFHKNFADPNSTEFKQYVDACKTYIANVKANVTAIKNALLSSDDTDFIKYLYESKHIYKKEYDAIIKQIEE